MRNATSMNVRRRVGAVLGVLAFLLVAMQPISRAAVVDPDEVSYEDVLGEPSLGFERFSGLQIEPQDADFPSTDVDWTADASDFEPVANPALDVVSTRGLGDGESSSLLVGDRIITSTTFSGDGVWELVVGSSPVGSPEMYRPLASAVIERTPGSLAQFEWEARDESGRVYSGTAAGPIEELCETGCGAWSTAASLVGVVVCAAADSGGFGAPCRGAVAVVNMRVSDLCDQEFRDCVNELVFYFIDERVPVHVTSVECLPNNAQDCAVHTVAGGPSASTPSLSGTWTFQNSASRHFGTVFWGYTTTSSTRLETVQNYYFYEITGNLDVPDWWWYWTCANELYSSTTVWWSGGSSAAAGYHGGPAGPSWSSPECLNYFE